MFDWLKSSCELGASVKTGGAAMVAAFGLRIGAAAMEATPSGKWPVGMGSGKPSRMQTKLVLSLNFKCSSYASVVEICASALQIQDAMDWVEEKTFFYIRVIVSVSLDKAEICKTN